jgi:hypothetical protein
MNSKSIWAMVAAALLSACVTTSTTTSAPAPAAPTPRSASAPASPAPDITRVYSYAQRGQSEAQQDRDRYECFNWAVQKSGFDPSRREVPREHREQPVPAHSMGETVVAGALMGATVGALVSNPWDRDEGAVVGAIAGTALGAVAANSQATAIRSAQEQVSPAYSSHEQQAAGYRRAMSACLEGRGYVVK